MKPSQSFSSLVLVLVLDLLSIDAIATPFYYDGRNADGTAQTNVITMHAWPAANTWTAVGTNIVYGGYTEAITITPSAAGFSSNWALPNGYRCIVSNLNSAFFVVIPQTEEYNDLASYITNSPTISGTYLDGFGLVTNWLGFVPINSNNPAVLAALTYTPATNTLAAAINLLDDTFTSNSFAGVTNALGYYPATNSNAGIQSALGYEPATNDYAGIEAALGFEPATNTYAGIVAALNYQPSTNNFSTGTGWSALTNGTAVWFFTNLASGVSPTVSLPDGSLLTGTNGAFYIRSNSAWAIK